VDMCFFFVCFFFCFFFCLFVFNVISICFNSLCFVYFVSFRSVPFLFRLVPFRSGFISHFIWTPTSCIWVNVHKTKLEKKKIRISKVTRTQFMTYTYLQSELKVQRKRLLLVDKHLESSVVLLLRLRLQQ
jgi:hypothetical protein